MNSINDILSDELKVQPLKEGERVEFRLVLFGQFNPSLNGPAIPALRGLAGRCDINDPFDPKRPTKQILNIKSLLPISSPGRETVYDPQIESVHFESTGGKVCTHNENNLYMYLKRHNKNRDNPWRNRKKEVVFYEVNEQRELKKMNDLFEFKTLAGYELIKASDRDLAIMASKLNAVGRKGLRIDISKPPRDIRKSLQQLSQINPADILLTSTIDEVVARVMVETAIDQRWIIFNDFEGEECWKWLRVPGEKGPKKIVSVTDPLADRNGDLVTFLVSKEGSDHFAELKMRHAQYYAVPETV
jgi:hypothetical protein